MRMQFSACEQDRKEYGLPEWVTYDKDLLDDLPMDQLDPWDRELINHFGFGINELIAREMLKPTMRGLTGIVWLCSKVEGVAVVDLAKFNIRPRKVRVRLPRADADPPSDSSTTSLVEGASETA